jgi:hypothetical protein
VFLSFLMNNYSPNIIDNWSEVGDDSIFKVG